MSQRHGPVSLQIRCRAISMMNCNCNMLYISVYFLSFTAQWFNDSNFINRMLYSVHRHTLTVSFYFNTLPFSLLSSFSDTILYTYTYYYYIQFNTCLQYARQLIKYCYCYCKVGIVFTLWPCTILVFLDGGILTLCQTYRLVLQQMLSGWVHVSDRGCRVSKHP